MTYKAISLFSKNVSGMNYGNIYDSIGLLNLYRQA